MAMNVGGGPGKSVTPAMNVTPLVDVVLVLLIIFLVVTPLMAKTFWVHLPKQEKEEVTQQQLDQDPNPPLVMKVLANDIIQVNGVEIGYDELAERLARMFAARDDHILFFDADDGVEYGFAISVLDQAREGGAVTIAPLVQPAATPGAAPGEPVPPADAPVESVPPADFSTGASS